MKMFFALSILIFTGVSSAAVSNEKWEAFCSRQTESITLNYCEKVDQVCELAGFESDRCGKARKDAMKKPAHPGKLEK